MRQIEQTWASFGICLLLLLLLLLLFCINKGKEKQNKTSKSLLHWKMKLDSVVVLGLVHIEVYAIRYVLYVLLSATDEIPLHYLNVVCGGGQIV